MNLFSAKVEQNLIYLLTISPIIKFYKTIPCYILAIYVKLDWTYCECQYIIRKTRSACTS